MLDPFSLLLPRSGHDEALQKFFLLHISLRHGYCVLIISIFVLGGAASPDAERERSHRAVRQPRRGLHRCGMKFTDIFWIAGQFEFEVSVEYNDGEECFMSGEELSLGPENGMVSDHAWPFFRSFA